MAHVKNTILAILLFVPLLSIHSTSAYAGAGADPFSAGSTRLSVIIGNGYAFNNSYVLIGVGAAYFLANGLDIGLDYEYWTGANPGIQKISPRVDYVVNTRSSIRPYIGAFYRRTMIDGFPDLDSIGGRVGLYFISGKGIYFGAGFLYESYLDCNTAKYASCDATYPEFIVAVSF